MVKPSSTPYWLAWSASRAIFEGIYRGDIYGTENIPKEGPFILAGNHESFFDPPMFGGALPREIAYFARKSLFKPGFSERLLTSLNSIPVDRDSGSDVSAFKRVFTVLKNGKGILLFPEGTRSPNGKLQRARKGIGLIACRAQVPVIPARISGSFKAYNRKMLLPDLRPPINIMFGPALSPTNFDPGKKHEDRYLESSNRIMDAVARLSVPEIIGSI